MWSKALTAKNIISRKCTWECLYGTRGFGQHNSQSMEIYCIPPCWLSQCWVTNYINHPQEICEDVFVMMQLHHRTHTLFKNALFQRVFHVLSLCWGEICLKQFLQLGLSKNHVQFLPPAALEATHTCRQSSRQSIQRCSDLNNGTITSVHSSHPSSVSSEQSFVPLLIVKSIKGFMSLLFKKEYIT